jgi:hypothetical protein
VASQEGLSSMKLAFVKHLYEIFGFWEEYFDPEDGAGTFIRNVGIYLPCHMALYFRRQ